MRHALCFVLAVGTLACAARDEIIATRPGGGGAGGEPPVGIVLSNPVTVASTCAVTSLEVGDVDGDGQADVVTTGDCVGLFVGTSEGSLEQSGEPLGPTEGRVALGRLDTNHPSDAADPLDLVVAGDPVAVWTGVGDGSFTALGSVAVGADVADVALVDLYADESLELVTVAGTQIALWTGDGSGAFVGPHPIEVGAVVAALGWADLDGDGHTDLVAAADHLVVLRNLDEALLDVAPIEASDGVTQVVLVELDGDGCVDVLALEQPADGEGRLHSWLNDCAGALSSGPEWRAPSGAVIDAFAAGDLDGDGLVDVVVATRDDGARLITLRGVGDASFTAPHEHALPEAARELALADLDGDGHAEVVAALSSGVAVFRR